MASITLHAGSKKANLRKSVDKFLKTRLIDQMGFDLDYGQPSFKEEGLEKWIQFRMLPAGGDYQRQVDSTRVGDIRTIFMVFNLFEPRPARRNIYRRHDLRKAVLEWVYLSSIPIHDYDTSGDPEVNRVRVLEIVNDGEVDSGVVSGLRQWNMTFAAKSTQKYTD